MNAGPAGDGDAARGARADRPTLVLLHGIGGGAAGFAWHVERLRGLGWPAIAWNQPGYGATAGVEPYTLERVAQALLESLDREGVERCIPIGHSMGGMVAQEFYALAPERVAALVLAHTSPAFGSPEGDFQRRFVEERTRPLDEGLTMADVAQRVVPGLLGDGATREAREAAIALMAAVPPATYRKAIAALVRFDRRGQLPFIAVPTLCLAAQADRTAPPAVLEKMATKIPGAVYRCLPGLGHLAPIENPQAFCEAIESFIGSIQ